MSNSKLLKEAIADAKTVRETAIANAKIALEEAFTPRLQSILSKKLQAEMEEEDEEPMEEVESSEIGQGDEEAAVEPSDDASDAHTELDSETEMETEEPGEEDENLDVVSEEEMESDEEEMEEGDYEESYHEGEDEEDDDLDLESIIRELEDEMEEGDYEESYNEGEGSVEDPTNADDAEISEEEEMESDEEEDEMIDLDEILREMGYDDEEEMNEEEEDDHSEMKEELEEAYSTIKELRSTINEVNLLNAKLLYANKLFRGYNLTNEQKSKVVENLDRTSSVREVKLVYATLAESMNFKGADRKTKRAIAESVAPSKSTAPQKEIISESSNNSADRFKKLAGIITK